MAGRQVRLPASPRRIVLLEARDMVTLSLLHPDPASRVAGWAAADRVDSALLQSRFERNGRIPEVGKQTPESVSLEGILSLAPDLVVASDYMAAQGDGSSLVTRLARVGVPVVIGDAANNSVQLAATGPLATLHRYLRMWGDILDAQDRATAFAEFVDARLARLAQRLEGVTPVVTYLEVQSTLDDCCWAAGQRVWGELLALAGGQTLPGVRAPWFQKLQPDALMTAAHEVYIASGGAWVSGGRPPIGPGLAPDAGRAALRRLASRPGFANLPSVRQHRVHGIWTGLITMAPLNLLFVEIAAKWLHPDRLAGLDPSQTLADINRWFRFAPVDGPLWVSLKE